MGNDYYIAIWDEDSEWSEDYSMLKGPNGFECCLTEPEDRVWYRDGQGVIGELNRLYAELNRPITEHPDVQRLIIQVETLSQENKRLDGRLRLFIIHWYRLIPSREREAKKQISVHKKTIPRN